MQEFFQFAHPVERELAAIFDALGIPWEYEPHTFVFERGPRGEIIEAFTPDFYLPDQDMYIECTTMRQRLTTRKNRKIRKLQAHGKLITVLYRRDFERLHSKYGFPLDLAGSANGSGEEQADAVAFRAHQVDVPPDGA